MRARCENCFAIKQAGKSKISTAKQGNLMAFMAWWQRMVLDLVLVGVEAHAPDRLADPRVGVALVEDAEGHPRLGSPGSYWSAMSDPCGEVCPHVLAERLRRRARAVELGLSAAAATTPRRAAAGMVH